jgi:hypothetical protein
MRLTLQCEFQLQHWIRALIKLIWINIGPKIWCEYKNILQHKIGVLIKVILYYLTRKNIKEGPK